MTTEPGMTSDHGRTDEPDMDAGIDEGDHLEDDELRAALEAVLLVVDTPATVDELASAVGQDRTRVRQLLRRMSADLTAAGSGIDLRFAGDGWRFYTRSDYAPYVEKLLLDGTRSKLTRAALETLAVVAYRQPVTRARVSAIRGVNVDGVVRTLLARGLISEAGTDETTNGTLYVTTELFLERLGLASLSDLPDIAPLLPGVDVIDDLGEELLDDPRFAKLGGGQAQSNVDVSAQALAEADEG
ncbi:SMC-Scp complex subunit ScpB [Gordonia sihwensis]|nr:segregation and condensation protein B [Gordonia sihwensis]MBY4571911.1 SMC-Scp complex subunit ScpB [Gordonia sihwensis]